MYRLKLLLIRTGAMLSWMFPEDVNACTRLLSLVFTGTRMGKFATWGSGSVLRYKPTCLHGLKYIKVGKQTLFDTGLQLTAWQMPGAKPPSIEIGDHCIFRQGAHISAVGSISIGNHLLAGTNVLISDNLHGESKRAIMATPPVERPLFSKGGITIGDNVWIGNNACILGNVSIGEGAIIGANAVVTHHVPAYHLAIGSPARMIEIKE